MNMKRHSSNIKNCHTSWIILILSFVIVTIQSIIVTPTPWDFQCDNGPGTYPHAIDCQRQDDHT